MKKQNHAGKKLIAVVLAMLLLVSFSLSACSSEETQSSSTGEASSTSSESSSEASETSEVSEEGQEAAEVTETITYWVAPARERCPGVDYLE